MIARRNGRYTKGKMWAVVLVLCSILSISVSEADVVLPCPPPNVNCSCTSVETGYISCQDINMVPMELPEKTTLLDISGNDFMFIYGEIVSIINVWIAIKSVGPSKSQ